MGDLFSPLPGVWGTSRKAATASANARGILRPQMSVFGIAHVQLAIAPGGEEAARAFYNGLLGLRELPKPAVLQDRGGIWFQCGMQEIHCGVEDPIAPTRRHPAFLIDNLDELKATLESAGFATESDRQLPGYRRFYALDPFGNRLEFLERD